MPRFRDVEVFLQVARVGSFRRAAASLGVAPATVSRAIRRLENHVGRDLVVRDGSGFRLTGAGATYRVRAKRAEALLREAERAVAAIPFRIGVVEQVRVGVGPGIGVGAVAHLLGGFVEGHPGVRLQLALARGPASDPDVVIRLGPGPLGPAVTGGTHRWQRPLIESPTVAVATEGIYRCLLLGEVVPMVEIAEQRLPSLPVRFGTSRPGMGVPDLWSGRDAALAGAGVALLPECLVRREVAEGRIRQVFLEWRLPGTSIWVERRAAAPGGSVDGVVDYLATVPAFTAAPTS